MSRNYIIITLMLMFILLSINKPVYAIDKYVHGDFATNTNSCAECHVTHAANSAYLLQSPYDRTRMCLGCHYIAYVMSKYNVNDGVTLGTDGENRPSPAGGFIQSADPYSDWAAEGATFNQNTSSHHVMTNQAVDLGMPVGQTDGDVPGGSSPFTGDFTCCSCHDPHAGGKYPADSGTYKNPRLLKKRPMGAATDKLVYMRIDYDYGVGDYNSQVPDNGTGHTLQVLEYGKGFNAWCGSCHDLFNTEGTGTEDPNRTGSNGITNNATVDPVDKYRHKVGVLLTSNNHDNFSTSIKDGTPLPTETTGDRDVAGASTNRISCMTCHRAHGSSVNVSVGFPRFKDYDTFYGGSLSSITVDDGASALLRLPERDVCFKCHGAAQYNSFNSVSDYGTGY